MTRMTKMTGMTVMTVMTRVTRLTWTTRTPGITGLNLFTKTEGGEWDDCDEKNNIRMTGITMLIVGELG